MDEAMIELFERSGICVGDSNARAALARRIAGYGIGVQGVEDALWHMEYTGVKNVHAILAQVVDKGMESFVDYCRVSGKMRAEKVKPEPGASLRLEDMERAAFVESGRAYAEKLAKGIPMDQWTEGERERYAWDQEDEEERKRYVEKFGEGKIDR